LINLLDSRSLVSRGAVFFRCCRCCWHRLKQEQEQEATSYRDEIAKYRQEATRYRHKQTASLQVRKSRAFFVATFRYKKDHFTKAGSGHT